jgi:hypothetical protein
MTTWADLDFSNHDVLQQEAARAGERIRAETERLQAMGIVDANWQGVKKGAE